VRPAAKSDWRLATWLGVVGLIVTVQYAGRASTGPPSRDVLYQWDTAIGTAIQYAVFLALILLIARGHHDLLGLRKPRSLRAAAGTASLVFIGVYIVAAVVSTFLDPAREQGLTPTSWESARAAPFFANAAVVCLVGPFVEELMFRGVGFSLIAARFGPEPAIVSTGILFGLYHGLVQGLPILIAFGIGLAWLRERQDSTIPGMILHGTFNAIALATAVLT
jgi:membrane protease YdiL (CAAX protease family)